MDAIDLHHLYRAMAWLGEELADQQGRGLVPRTNKELIEEQLFAKRRSLFHDVGLAIFDTTSLYFEGDGGNTLGRNGHAKDARPDLHQLVLGVVIDETGRRSAARCAGNTGDVKPDTGGHQAAGTLPAHRVCIIADRAWSAPDHRHLEDTRSSNSGRTRKAQRRSRRRTGRKTPFVA